MIFTKLDTVRGAPGRLLGRMGRFLESSRGRVRIPGRDDLHPLVHNDAHSGVLHPA